MRELIQKRVARLKARKQELLSQVKALRASTVCNAGHKVDMLNQQVLRLGAKIIKLKEDK